MKTPEIQEYFLRNHGKKVCGRFNNDQLNTIQIHIPVQIMYSQTQFHKIFLLALLFSMGTTLISCSDISGNRHNIESVEIVNDEKRDYDTTMGASLNIDSTMIKKEPLRSVNTSLPNRKFAAPIALKGDVIIESLIPEPTKEKKSEEKIDIIHIDTIP